MYCTSDLNSIPTATLRRVVVFGALLVSFAWSIAGLPGDASGQQVILDQESYLEPPSPILEQVTQPWQTNLRLSNISPDGTKFLITVDEGMVALEQMAQPYVVLGEMSIQTQAHRSKSQGIRSDAGYVVRHYLDDNEIAIQLPDGTRVSGARWSPDGSQIAFLGHTPEGTYLHIADTATGESRKVTDRPLLATHVSSFDWSLDGSTISAVLLPESSEFPQPGDVATEPKIRVTRNGEIPSRTYRFLLQTPYDMALLEYFSVGQLAVINVSDGSIANVGEARMFRSADMSPRGDLFRAQTILKPFSYFVPASQFGNTQDLYDADGNVLHNFSKYELGQPRGQQRPDGDDEDEDDAPKRDIRWRPDGDGISFLQLAPPEPDEDADDSGDDAPDSDSSDDAQGDGAQDDQDDGEEGGDDEEEPARKDRVMRWIAPYGEDDVEVVYESDDPISRVQYSQDCQILFLTQRIDERMRITAIDLDRPETPFVVFQQVESEGGDSDGEGDPGAGARGRRGGRGGPQGGRGRQGRGGRNPQDDTGDDNQTSPGQPADDADEKPEPRGASEGTMMSRSTAAGDSVVRISSGGDVFFSGSNDPDDDEDDALPKVFIDRVNIESGEVTRIYESDGQMLESIAAVDTDDINRVFVTRERRTVVQDTFMIDIESGEETQMTHNQNFTPWYGELIVERFQVERIDGIKFWVTAYRNPDFGMQLPAMFWFYPREYDSQESYDRSAQRGDSPAARERFRRPSTRSMTHLTQIGYVVVEPDCPIIGESGEWNNNFIPDLRNNLWAVIDAMDKKGWIDRDRLGIGGHSYGAFGTANAMAHTPFFKAGIAGDGNYNRTLTPMSFQREPRSLWEAREIYTQMSPLFWTNQINGALLMYHGIDDANVGTWPINSERMFQALDGTGKPASLYMYPYEGHGPVARATQLDMWARWVEWLDLYVKHPERGRALAEEDEDEEDSDER